MEENGVAKQSVVIDQPFEVRLQRSGRTVSIPAGETILETLLEEGVEVVYPKSVSWTANILVPDGSFNPCARVHGG